MVKSKNAAAKFEHLNWKYLLCAVIGIFRANQRLYLLCARPAKSRDWVLFRGPRNELWECVRDEWASLTGVHSTLFPYSEDYIVNVYATVKEMDGAELLKWEAECATRKPEKKKPHGEGSEHG